MGEAYLKIKSMLKSEKGVAVLDYREAVDRNGPFLDTMYVSEDKYLIVNGRNMLQITSNAPVNPLEYLKQQGCKLRG